MLGPVLIGELIEACGEGDVFGQPGGGDFETEDIELRYAIDVCFVPARSIPVNFYLTAIAVDLAVLLELKFEATLEVAVGISKRTFPRLRQLFRRVYNVDGPLLKLDGVTTRTPSDTDQLLCNVNIPIVVNPDLSGHIARSARSDNLRSQSNFRKPVGGVVIIFELHRKVPL